MQAVWQHCINNLHLRHRTLQARKTSTEAVTTLQRISFLMNCWQNHSRCDEMTIFDDILPFYRVNSMEELNDTRDIVKHDGDVNPVHLVTDGKT